MSPVNPAYIKIAIVCLALATTFGAGMTVESWRRDSNELVEVKDAKARYVGAVEKSEKTANKLQTELDRLAGTKHVITKEIHHETQRVEYRCSLPATGRVLYMRAATGDTTVTGDLPKSVPIP